MQVSRHPDGSKFVAPCGKLLTSGDVGACIRGMRKLVLVLSVLVAPMLVVACGEEPASTGTVGTTTAAKAPVSAKPSSTPAAATSSAAPADTAPAGATSGAASAAASGAASAAPSASAAAK